MDRKFWSCWRRRIMSTVMATILFVLVLLIAGCNSKMQSDEEDTLMKKVNDITKISVAKSTVYNKFNDDFFVTFEEDLELDVWKKAFQTAKREKIDLDEVNFDILVTEANGGYYLLQGYVGEPSEESVFFFIGHEGKMYLAPKEITKSLREMIAL